MTAVNAVKFVPGSHAEITDPFVNSRKLVLVDDTGSGYFDLHGEGQVPRPLLLEYQPVSLGSIQSWIVPLEQPKRDLLMEAWQWMSDNSVDQLTIARAIRWACENDAADVETIFRAGKGLTEHVSNTRKMVLGALAG